MKNYLEAVSSVSRRVLFITEGPIDELRLLKDICRDLHKIYEEYEFYSYRTDFHQFVRLLIPDGIDEIDKDLDIQLTLKSHEQSNEEREKLSQKYTDIYIIFDLDPHAIKVDFDKIRLLSTFFTNSSDMGRLFINYPMMQSYKHLKSLPDIDFESRTVTISDIKRYKELVAREALDELLKAHEYSHIQLYEIACHHFCKREKILGRDYKIDAESKYSASEDIKIFDKEVAQLKEKGFCDVLNTSVLIYFEYAPERFLREITTHRNKFRI